PDVAVLSSAVALAGPSVGLLAFGFSGIDIYGWLGAFAVYGFITIYGLTCIALPLQLKQQGALSLPMLVVAILAGISMIMALAGKLYPVPDPPYSRLPYFFFCF